MESTLAELVYPARTLLNFYFYFLITIYFWSFLTPKPRFTSRQAFLLTIPVSLLGMVISLVLYAYLVPKLILAVLMHIILLGFIYRDSLLRRTLVVLFYVVLLMLSEGIVAAIVVFQLGVSMPMMAGDPEIIVWTIPLQMLVYTLCYGTPSLMVRRRFRSGYTIPLGQFIILPLSQVLMLGGFLYTLYISDRPPTTADAMMTTLMITACIITDLVFLRVITSLVEKKKLEDQQTLLNHHYTALSQHQDYIRKLRHDMANHLMTASILAKEDSNQAEAYLHSLTEEFQSMAAIDFCQNRIADAVLYGKAAEAAAAGISFTVSAILSEDLMVRKTDLMSLLSNLLDNALEAAVQGETPWVTVSIQEKAGTVLIQVRNSLAVSSPDLSRTTKADVRLHGLGHKIVEDICRKYEGSFTYRIENGTFEASVMLLNIHPS